MAQSNRKKVGIMGGTFDPIHIGHLILAEKAYAQFGLDKVLVMPSGNPPHKPQREGRAALEQRVQMSALAIEGNDHFELSLIETEDQGYTYTCKTLQKLTADNPDTDYYFIMGADSLKNFSSWKDPEEICRLCHVVVAVRGHMDTSSLDKEIALTEAQFGVEIHRLNTRNIDISSEILRKWIAEKKPIRYYVPDRVKEYIEKERLYQITGRNHGTK